MNRQAYEKALADYDTMFAKGAPREHIELWLGDKHGITFTELIKEKKRRAPAKGKVTDAGFGRSLVQGLSLGFGDEIEAFVRSLKGEDYESTLASIRLGLEDYKKTNPATAFMAEVTGAALPTIGALVLAPLTGGASTAAVAPSAANLMGRAALTGGAVGALEGIGTGNTPEERVKGAYTQGPFGAVMGAGGQAALTGLKAAKDIVKPYLFPSGRNSIAGEVLNKFATNPKQAQDNLAQAAELVPGSRPRTAEVARDPGIAGLETPVRSTMDETGRIAQRISEQNAARQRVMSRISGEGPETIAAAKAKRDEVTGPMRERAFNASPVTDQAFQNGAVLTIQQKIADILASPGGKRETVRSALSSARTKIDRAQNVRDLYEIRKDLRLARDGKLKGADENSRFARGQLGDVMATVDYVIEQAAPGYQAYMNRYSKMSRPIDQMERLQGFRSKSATAAPDIISGEDVLSQAKFKNQMRGDNSALSSSQMRQIKNIMSDLNRSTAPGQAGRVAGSNTMRNMTMASVVGRIVRDPDSKVGTFLTDRLGFLTRIPENRVKEVLVEAMLDPALAKDLMSEASDAAAKRVADGLRRKIETMGIAIGTGQVGGSVSEMLFGE